MNILLVIRSEIIAVFILAFLIIYNKICSRYREGSDCFNGLALASLGHAAFGLITEITVNLDGFSPVWNKILHVIFFVFALMFSVRYFQYAVSLIFPQNKSRTYLIIAHIITGCCILAIVFFPMHYLQGNGTKYCAGLGPTLCYTVGFVLLLLADILILVFRKQINAQTVMLLIPLSIMTLIFLGIQIAVPEFLFTGCALTITVVGVFFAIENPIGKFQNRAFIDNDTGLWGRNRYDFDIANTFTEEKNNRGMIYVLADINGLKSVNDNFGHLEGDALIKICADAMSESMKHAYKVYRIGGDEFAAVYFGTPADIVFSEIEDVRVHCREKSAGHSFMASMSIGYSERNSNEAMDEVVRNADMKMYEEKKEHYRITGIERRKM